MTDHGRGRLPYLGLADLFGVHYAPTRAVFLVAVQEVRAFSCSLRLDPARNNQQRGTRLAANYELDRWTTERFVALTAGGAAAETRSRSAA
jgi:hypothetical protein